MMHVSHNEVVSLCEKAFLACQRRCGEADSIARMVADLEMVGFNGLSLFVDALACLQQEEDAPLKVTYHDASHDETPAITCNLQGRSILCHFPALLDYALETLTTHCAVEVLLQNCHNRWLAYGKLLEIAQKGFSVQAHWSNGHAPYQVQYILNAGQKLPDIYLYDQPQDDVRTLRLSLQKTPHKLAPMHAQYQQHISRAKLSKKRQAAWKEGISVDKKHWAFIKEKAQSILVETSDISQTRAGE